VPGLWGGALLAVAFAGAPGRSIDALVDRLALLQPPAFEPATLTVAVLMGIPAIMLAAIAASIVVGRA
jgi:hypothetical protein